MSTQALQQLLEVANSILAPDMIDLLPSEYVAKVRTAITAAHAAQALQPKQLTDGELCELFENAFKKTKPYNFTRQEIVINGAFSHYADSYTDSAFAGFRAGYRAAARKAKAQQWANEVTLAAWHDVLAERLRQVEAEGWTPEHDDQYGQYTLAAAAGSYAMHTLAYPIGNPPPTWPWNASWWKPSADPRRNWIKATALMLAEIEREDRAALATQEKEARA